MGAKGKKVTDRKDDQTENGSTLTEKQAERIRQSIELMAKTVPMKIDELLPYQRNQKDHPESQVRNLANSLRRFGWVQPVVIDENNVIVIGHGRVLGAKLLGLTEAPVVRTVDLSEDEIRELRIIDNKLNESEWNEYLQQDVEELTFEGFDLDFEKFLTGGGYCGTGRPGGRVHRRTTCGTGHTAGRHLPTWPASFDVRRQYGSAGRGQTDGRTTGRRVHHESTVWRIKKRKVA